MSSACVCHLGEWCFYCEMYHPLERRIEFQTAALKSVIKDLEYQKSKYENEKPEDDEYKKGLRSGIKISIDHAIINLREVVER